MKINEQPGKFTGPNEVRIVRLLPGPIERVWEYLTNPEKRARWFAGGPMELRVGGKVRFDFQHKSFAPDETPPDDYKLQHEQGFSMSGIVTRCEAPHVLAFTFGSDGESVATFELTSQGKNVMLVVTHRSSGGDLPFMAEFASGWHTHLTHLIALLEGTQRPPFWPVYTKLKIDYEKLRIVAQQT